MKQKTKLSKLSKIELYDLNLKVKNICNDIEKAWKNNRNIINNISEKQENGTFLTGTRINDFSMLNQIEDKKLRNLFKKCIQLSVKKGEIYKTIKDSGIDLNTFYRFKKSLKIPNLNLGKERQTLESNIIEDYLVEKLSTEEIGLKYGFCAGNINHILKKNKIKLRPKHCNNPLRFATRSGIDKDKLIDILYSKFILQKKSLKQIAIELKLDQGTISTKLHAMGLSSRIKKRSNSNKKFKCLWCAKENNAWTTGKKQQKYCSGKPASCKNHCKDLRRGKGSIERINKMLFHLNNVWGDEYKNILNKIMENSPGQDNIISYSNNLFQKSKGVLEQ